MCVWLKLMLIPFSHAEAQETQSSLQLERVGGTVELFRSNKATVVAREYKLLAGDILRVAFDGKARVAAQNAKVDLGSGSIVRIGNSKKGILEEITLLFGNFRVQGERVRVDFPNLSLTVQNGTFYTHVFTSENELGRSLSGQKIELPTLSEVFTLSSSDTVYTHVNCLQGSASVNGSADLSLKSEELLRAVGKVVDPVSRKIGKDAILASVRSLGFL